MGHGSMLWWIVIALAAFTVLIIYAKLFEYRTGDAWKKSGLTPFSFIDVLTPHNYEQRGRHLVVWLWLALAVLAIAVFRVM